MSPLEGGQQSQAQGPADSQGGLCEGSQGPLLVNKDQHC